MGVLMAGVCLQAQQAPQTASKEPDPLLRPGNLPPRSSAGEYQFHVQAGTVTITAEFMGHGVPTLEGGPYTTEDFVIVETALFGPPGAKLALSYQDFSMRINGKKIPVPSSPYLAVFKSLKDPEWEPTNADKDKGKNQRRHWWKARAALGAARRICPPSFTCRSEMQRCDAAAGAEGVAGRGRTSASAGLDCCSSNSTAT